MKNMEPIVSLYWRQTPQNRALQAVLLIVGGVCLLTLSAKFKVPYYPVPQTLQTLVILLLPFIGGGRAALATVAAYLALGAAGLPVFASGGGWTYLIGVTGGFLLAFLPATWLIATLARRGIATGFVGVLLCLLAGDLLIFLSGVSWLALAIGDWGKAAALGFYPFIIGDLSKVVLAAAIVVLAHKARRGA